MDFDERVVMPSTDRWSPYDMHYNVTETFSDPARNNCSHLLGEAAAG